MDVSRRAAVSLWVLAILWSTPHLARAQPIEAAGSRALGMAGAFVAVADDASAVYWNPAGLADGDLFGAELDLQWLDWPRAQGAGSDRGPLRARTWLVGLATPPLGLAFYHLSEAGRDRHPPEAPPPGEIALARLDTTHIGVTVLHTVANGVDVGGTVKYVRGSAASGVAMVSSSDVPERADDLDARTGNALDIDLGAHVTAGPLRVGLVVRNLLEPSFKTHSGRELTLGRQVRLGIAVEPLDGWTLAADADLLEAESATTRWRRAAVGTERWWLDRRIALRGGMRFNTLGRAAPVGALGASLAVLSRLFLEAQATVGHREAEDGWGLSLRFGF